MTYRNHDMEDYIDYHDKRYILHITTIWTNTNIGIVLNGMCQILTLLMSQKLNTNVTKPENIGLIYAQNLT